MDFTQLTFWQALVLLLLALLFAKETLWRAISKKLGIEEEERMPLWASKLIGYVNHDQTEKIDEIARKIEEHNEIVFGIRDEMRGGIRDIKNKYQEWDKYGVPCRKIEQK